MRKPSEMDNNYIQCFRGNPAGQRVLEDLKAWLNYGKTVYNPSSTNENLHFELGKQSVINDIVYRLEMKYSTQEE